MSRRTYSRNAFETTLNGSIGSGDATITLTTTTGLTAPGWLAIDPDSPTLREYIKYEGISSNDLTTVTRGGAGSAGGPQAHTGGITVRSVPVHQTQDDVFDDIEDLEANEITGGNSHDHAGGDGAQIDHAGLANLTSGDPHTQYRLESADHTHASTGIQAGQVAHSDLTGVSPASSAHVTNGDSHDHSGGDGAQIAHSTLSGIDPASSTHVTGGDSHTHSSITGIKAVIKQVDQSIDTETVLALDDELFFAIGANEDWIISTYILFEGTLAGDLKHRLVGPAGCTLSYYWAPQLSSNDVISVFGPRSESDTGLQVGAATSNRGLMAKGAVINGGTAGNVGIEWAENTSSGNLTVRKHSFIIGWRVN
jgi:hypothetical protein